MPPGRALPRPRGVKSKGQQDRRIQQLECQVRRQAVQIEKHRERDVAVGGEVYARMRKSAPARAQIVDLAAKGNRNHDIAVNLGLSVNTVKTHLRLAMQDLGVANRAQLAYLLGG